LEPARSDHWLSELAKVKTRASASGVIQLVTEADAAQA